MILIHTWKILLKFSNNFSNKKIKEMPIPRPPISAKSNRPVPVGTETKKPLRLSAAQIVSIIHETYSLQDLLKNKDTSPITNVVARGSALALVFFLSPACAFVDRNADDDGGWDDIRDKYIDYIPCIEFIEACMRKLRECVPHGKINYLRPITFLFLDNLKANFDCPAGFAQRSEDFIAYAEELFIPLVDLIQTSSRCELIAKVKLFFTPDACAFEGHNFRTEEIKNGVVLDSGTCEKSTDTSLESLLASLSETNGKFKEILEKMNLYAKKLPVSDAHQLHMLNAKWNVIQTNYNKNTYLLGKEKQPPTLEKENGPKELNNFAKLRLHFPLYVMKQFTASQSSYEKHLFFWQSFILDMSNNLTWRVTNGVRSFYMCPVIGRQLRAVAIKMYNLPVFNDEKANYFYSFDTLVSHLSTCIQHAKFSNEIYMSDASVCQDDTCDSCTSRRRNRRPHEIHFRGKMKKRKNKRRNRKRATASRIGVPDEQSNWRRHENTTR